MNSPRVFIGYDGREQRAYEVALRSLRAHAAEQPQVTPLVAAHLRGEGLYWRPEEFRDGVRFDVISNAPMSTEFALTRFLVPALCDFEGWAVFCDCDFLFRADIGELFALADPAKAVQVVQHNYAPLEGSKMDNQPQAAYPRKNWSSLILWNCSHPAHRTLDLDDINRVPGLKLHAFWWLADALIGALPAQWNALVLRAEGSALRTQVENPSAVHFTLGTPDMPGYEHSEYADEWRSYAGAAHLLRACGETAGDEARAC